MMKPPSALHSLSFWSFLVAAILISFKLEKGKGCDQAVVFFLRIAVFDRLFAEWYMFIYDWVV